MSTDFLMNGQGYGNVATTLVANNFDPAALRPYVAENGRSYRSLTVNGVTQAVTTNTDATLRVREWQLLDETVTRAAKFRLKAWKDLTDRGMTYRVPNGMAHTVLQYQTMTDISPATTSMDGLRMSERDRPTYDLRSLPLPIIAKDFSFSARELAISRNGSMPLDTTVAGLAGQRVAEEVEKYLIGVNPTYQYGGGSVYGYRNFPDRITYSMILPTNGTWTPAKTINDILAMRQAAESKFHYGPYVLYVGTLWNQFMDADYSTLKGDNTLRERITKIGGLPVVSLDYLPGYEMILVQMTDDTIQAVTGMDITTVQWQDAGGMALNFKVMCIQVPRLKSDHNSNSGIVHAS